MVTLNKNVAMVGIIYHYKYIYALIEAQRYTHTQHCVHSQSPVIISFDEMESKSQFFSSFSSVFALFNFRIMSR